MARPSHASCALALASFSAVSTTRAASLETRSTSFTRSRQAVARSSSSASSFFCAASFLSQGFFQSLAMRAVHLSSAVKQDLAASSRSFRSSRSGESLGKVFRNDAAAFANAS